MRLPAVLYVGAGVDLPLSHIPISHRLVCVDGQPFSEFGVEQCVCHDDTNCFSRSRFLAHLDQSAARLGLSIQVDSEVRSYGDRVRYYTNTSMPEHLDRLSPEAPFSTLLVRGHHPHACVLDVLSSKGNRFIGFPETMYDDVYEHDTVIHRLHHCESTRSRFRMFTLIEDAGSLHCADWFDFVHHARRGRVL